MVRYSITFRRSRWGTPAPPDWRPVGPPGARLLVARRETRRAPASWSLVGSFAVHACMAVVLVLIARRIPPPAQPVAETITVVFTPAPVAELSDVPSVPDVAAEPPRIQPPPEPQPPTAAPLPSPPITIPEPEPPPVDLETPPPSIPPPPAPASPEPIPEPESSPSGSGDPATLVDPSTADGRANEAHHAPTDPKTRATATPQQCPALSSRTGAGANASGYAAGDTGELAAPGGDQSWLAERFGCLAAGEQDLPGRGPATGRRGPRHGAFHGEPRGSGRGLPAPFQDWLCNPGCCGRALAARGAVATVPGRDGSRTGDGHAANPLCA